MMRDKDADVRHRAVTALGVIQPYTKESIQALVHALDDQDDRVRGVASLFVGEVGPRAREAVPALVRMVQRQEWLASGQAIRALGNIGPDAKAAVPALTAMIASKDQRLVTQAAAALHQSEPENERSVRLLVGLLTTAREARDRMAAAVALGSIGEASRPAIGPLVKALQDPDPGVRYWAAKAVLRLDRQSGSAMNVLASTVVQKNEFLALLAAIDLGDSGLATPVVLQALESTLAANRYVSVQAALALWKLKPRNELSFPTLLKALENADPLMRGGSAEAFGKIGPDAKSVVPALLRRLNDRDAGVRSAADDALWRIDPAAAAKAEAQK
jgi:HEAT repeat protein